MKIHRYAYGESTAFQANQPVAVWASGIRGLKDIAVVVHKGRITHILDQGGIQPAVDAAHDIMSAAEFNKRPSLEQKAMASLLAKVATQKSTPVRWMGHDWHLHKVDLAPEQLTERFAALSVIAPDFIDAVAIQARDATPPDQPSWLQRTRHGENCMVPEILEKDGSRVSVSFF